VYEANEETGLLKKMEKRKEEKKKKKVLGGGEQRICTVEDIYAHQGINKNMR
jgi:hypothetical protein